MCTTLTIICDIDAGARAKGDTSVGSHVGSAADLLRSIYYDLCIRKWQEGMTIDEAGHDA